ncbi:unnamed protein product, partial [Amoebophrya sp. A120]
SRGEPVIFFASADQQSSPQGEFDEEEQRIVQAKAQEIFRRKGGDTAVNAEKLAATSGKIHPADEKELQEALDEHRRRTQRKGSIGGFSGESTAMGPERTVPDSQMWRFLIVLRRSCAQFLSPFGLDWIA